MIEHIYFELECDCSPNFEEDKGGHLEYSRVMCYNDLSRGDAEDFLRGLPAGSYLVRPCSDKAGNKLSLSVVSEESGPLNHYLIRLDNGYKLEGRHDRFCCLKSFLKAHSQYYLGLQVKLRIPIFSRSLFHMIEIWEYETSRSRWEGFSQEQTYRLATLRKTINPVHTFEDGSTVNVKLGTREVPCIYGKQIQNVRMRYVYGLCDRCTLKTIHPILKHSHHTRSAKHQFRIWEYYDGSEWRCFEYGKASFQHFLASFSLLCKNGTVKDKAITIRDSYGTQWYIDLINDKITNYSSSGAVRSYVIRQREVHGVTCDDIHQEKERYLSRDNHNALHVLQNTYCNAHYTYPPTWNNKLVHTLATTSEEYRHISCQIPLPHRTHISSVIRIQDTDSWHMFSKEHQLLSLTSSSVKVDLLWSDSTMNREHEASDKNGLETSLITHDCIYFDRHIQTKQNFNTLVLCKVAYDPSDNQSVVDDPFHATTVHMDTRHRDAITPLFCVFFNPALKNASSNNCKTTDEKTVALEMKTLPDTNPS
ncbi:uncharacterized protein LOC134824883 isoform X1 [Bolinopsis microptera]|uniref:uncharacterized protein LOC134824883 isoform X1 n=1 Tax=Bolinopsis microptera TaxID=2820187 RepID=UPI00307A977B